ncbi:MAG: hypothetical protein ACQGVC_08600 [Myxococcota bacterium]
MRQTARPSVLRVVALLLALLLVGSSAAHAQEAADPAEPDAPKGYFVETSQVYRGSVVAFDAVLLRPLAAVATGLGFALYVPAALMSLAEGPDAREEAWEHFVETPAKGVYERPLGDL